MTSSHFSLNCPPLYSDFFPAFHFHSPHPSYCTLMTSYFKRPRIMAHPRLAWDFFLGKRAVAHPHCSDMPSLTLWRRLNGTDQLHLKKSLDRVTVIGWARHRQNQIVQNYISKENSPEALSNGEGDTLIRGKEHCQTDMSTLGWLPQSSVKIVYCKTTTTQISGVSHLKWTFILSLSIAELLKYQPRRLNSLIKGF